MTYPFRLEFLLLLSPDYAPDMYCPYIKKASGGHPSKLSEQDIRYAIRLIGTGKAENAVQVTKALQDSTNQPLSAQTV